MTDARWLQLRGGGVGRRREAAGETPPDLGREFGLENDIILVKVSFEKSKPVLHNGTPSQYSYPEKSIYASFERSVSEHLTETFHLIHGVIERTQPNGNQDNFTLSALTAHSFIRAGWMWVDTRDPATPIPHPTCGSGGSRQALSPRGRRRRPKRFDTSNPAARLPGSEGRDVLLKASESSSRVWLQPSLHLSASLALTLGGSMCALTLPLQQGAQTRFTWGGR